MTTVWYCQSPSNIGTDNHQPIAPASSIWSYRTNIADSLNNVAINYIDKRAGREEAFPLAPAFGAHSTIHPVSYYHPTMSNSTPSKRSPLIDPDGLAEAVEERANSCQVKPSPLPSGFYAVALLVAIPPLAFEFILPFVSESVSGFMGGLGNSANRSNGG